MKEAMDPALRIYYRQIEKSMPLTSRQEVDLTVRIRKGDKKALQQLVMANLKFVVSVARTYQNQGLPLIDLINEGNVGLISAALRFDERKNFRFISYAVWWIRQAILQVLAENSRIVRLPLNRVGDIYKIKLAERKLEQHLRRPPSIDEIAGELEVSEETVAKMLQMGIRHASLDAPLSMESQSSLHDVLTSGQEHDIDEKLAGMSLNKEMLKILEVLEKREKEIIKLYYGIDHANAYTLEDIARKYNITRERVRQIKEKALMKLKRPIINRKLRPFLDNG